MQEPKYTPVAVDFADVAVINHTPLPAFPTPEPSWHTRLWRRLRGHA